METLMMNGVTHMWPVFTQGAAGILMEDPGLAVNRPTQDDWRYYNLTNLVMLAVRRHFNRRVRAYDFQETEGDRGEYHPMQLVLAWEEGGTKLIISSRRLGRNAWNFRAPWTGYSIFIRMVNT